MFDFLKKIIRKKDESLRLPSEEYEKHSGAKQAALEKILGPMHELVGHSVVPFSAGGAVDMFYFPNAINGTGFVTMELIQPDGTGPKPNTTGTYELVAFTKHKISFNNGSAGKLLDNESDEFCRIERRIRNIFTKIGIFSFQAVINPFETCEVPYKEGEENICIVFDEYKKDDNDFVINGKKHGLLLCIEIFRSEMEYARQNGSGSLLTKLREKGFYPYSDLDRAQVV